MKIDFREAHYWNHGLSDALAGRPSVPDNDEPNLIEAYNRGYERGAAKRVTR